MDATTLRRPQDPGFELGTHDNASWLCAVASVAEAPGNALAVDRGDHVTDVATSPENEVVTDSRGGRIRSAFRWGWLAACLLLAVWAGKDQIGHTPGDQAAMASVATAPSRPDPLPSRSRRLLTVPIETVRVGTRVAGRNPLREQVDAIEPDQQTWRHISLVMHKADGGRLWVDLLRPAEWVSARGAVRGAIIALHLPEMGAVGPAAVLSVGPSPAIPAGQGTVVTGTFRHETDGPGVLRLRLEGEANATGVTANHPYWSEDRQAFIQAGDLRPGERLNTEFGSRQIAEISRHEYVGLLYNLETTEHVYRVDVSGTLVHNSCDVAFGYGKYLVGFVEGLRSVGKNVECYPFPLLAKKGDGIWPGIFRAMKDSEKIHFNTQGLDYDEYVDWFNTMKGGLPDYLPFGNSHDYTFRELYEVLRTGLAKSKTTFYDGYMKTVPTPLHLPTQ